MQTKICEICGKLFETNRPTKKTCSKECHKIRMNAYFCKRYYEDIEESHARVKRNCRIQTQRAKDEFFAHYGECCAVCGETDKNVLTLDHINNDGAEHRKRVGDNTYMVIKDLRENGWPEGMQTLCYNCNNKKKIQQQTINGASATCILREAVITKLGGKCAHCGIDDPQMLEIRPKNGDIKTYKNTHSNRNAILKHILEDDDFASEFEILCVNCHRKVQYGVD